MQSYPLDLTTMLYNLRGQRGRLSATLERVPGLREPCQAILDLVEGKVTVCTLVTRRRAVVAEGARALDLLSRLGTIDWFWEPALAPPLSLPGGGLPRNPALVVPRRLDPFPPEALLACSRFQRRVLSLVDGRRSVADIATLLAVPATDLERLQAILSELEELGLMRR
jgi:hypothetical protein